MNILRAVFWDVDGTIADTELEGHRIAFNRAFSDYDLDWSWNQSIYQDLLKISGGLNRIRFYNKSAKGNVTDDICSKIQKRKGFHYDEIIKSGIIKPREGVLRLINELYSHNVSQYIVTTSGRNSLEPLLKKILDSAIKCFSGTITYEDVTCLKPHPEAYLNALDLCNVPEENCLAIEDSHNGVSSAKAANINCLMTPPQWFRKEDINSKDADACVDSLGSITKPSNLIYGIPMMNSFVDFDYLSSLII